MTLRKFMAAFALLLVVAVVGGCKSANQKLLEADESYSVTQDRVIRYVQLPACPEAAPACHDPAVKQSFKDQAAKNLEAKGADEVEAAHDAYLSILAANRINCRVDESCP